VLPSPYVLNGPPDQAPLYDSLLQLQMRPQSAKKISSAVYQKRLSLVEQVNDELSWQASLEAPKQTAVAWNSNYGSHGWHRYVGRFPPHLVRALLNHFQATRDDVVLDPFAGSGTTNVECRLLGIPSVGIEISPLSALIARTKSCFPATSQELVRLMEEVTRSYTERWSAFHAKQRSGAFDHASVLAREGNLVGDFPNYEKWLTPEALLGVSIVAEVAAGLEGPLQDALLVALSAKMRSIGNVDVDVVRAEYRREPRVDVDVLRLVRSQLKKMASTTDAMLATHPEAHRLQGAEIHQQSVLEAEFAPASISHVITSPPYGVESLSYLRTHLLSFRCLEPFLDTDPYATGDGVIGSEYSSGAAPSPTPLAYAPLSQSFERFFLDRAPGQDKKLRRRTAMMMQFFDDIGRVAERLRLWMKPGGQVAFVIGNKRLGEDVIPADRMVTELFDAQGFELRHSIEHKLKTNNSNSQVPWQERIIQNEYILLMSKR
jgi:hypothetical protein